MSEPETGAGVLPAGDLPPAPQDARTVNISDAMINDFIDQLLRRIPHELIMIADSALMIARPLIAVRYAVDVKGGILGILKQQITGIMTEREGKAIALFTDPDNYLTAIQVVADDHSDSTATVFKIAAAIPAPDRLLDSTTLGDPGVDGDGENDVHEASDQSHLPTDADSRLLTG